MRPLRQWAAFWLPWLGIDPRWPGSANRVSRRLIVVASFRALVAESLATEQTTALKAPLRFAMGVGRARKVLPILPTKRGRGGRPWRAIAGKDR
jgi:hypothetical protein